MKFKYLCYTLNIIRVAKNFFAGELSPSSSPMLLTALTATVVLVVVEVTRKTYIKTYFADFCCAWQAEWEKGKERERGRTAFVVSCLLTMAPHLEHETSIKIPRNWVIIWPLAALVATLKSSNWVWRVRLMRGIQTHTHTYTQKESGKWKQKLARKWDTHTHRGSTWATPTTERIEVKASKQWITQPGSLTPLPSPDPALLPSSLCLLLRSTWPQQTNSTWSELDFELTFDRQTTRQRCTTRQSPRGKWKSACKRKSTLQARRQLTSSLIPELLTTRPQFAPLPSLSPPPLSLCLSSNSF